MLNHQVVMKSGRRVSFADRKQGYSYDGGKSSKSKRSRNYKC